MAEYKRLGDCIRNGKAIPRRPFQRPPSVVKKNQHKFCIVPDNLYICH